MDENLNYSFLAPPEWISINPDTDLTRQIAQVVKRETKGISPEHAKAMAPILTEQLVSVCTQAFEQDFSLLCFPNISVAGIPISSVMTFTETDLSELGEPLDVVGMLAAVQDDIRLIDSEFSLVVATTTRALVTDSQDPEYTAITQKFEQATQGLGPIQVSGERKEMLDLLSQHLRSLTPQQVDSFDKMYTNRIMYYIVNPDHPSNWIIMLAQYYDNGQENSAELSQAISDLYDTIAGTVRIHNV